MHLWQQRICFWITCLGCLGLFGTASVSAAPAPQTTASAGIDWSDPVSVTRAVFEAARTQNDAYLKSLCDPKGKNDGDTRSICSLHKKHRRWKEFLKYFTKAKVTSKARIRGNRAKVRFLFGPTGKKKEIMNLIRRGKRWYLYSF